MIDLNIFWFLVLGVLLTGYAILDGFDWGVGILHLLGRDDHERRITLNSIGPLWDGNEVWLVTFGGALFAAFPDVYATVFSGFYLPFMLLLFALIFRAVAIEFRSKHPRPRWRHTWDGAFFGASAVAPVLFGTAIGNILQGMPIDHDMEFVGTLMGLLNPYALLVGVFVLSLMAMHGSIYLYLKTEGEFQQRIHNTMWTTFGLFVAFYMLTTIVTLIHVPQVTRNFAAFPFAWVVIVGNVLAVANIPRAIYIRKPVYAFLSSVATIIALNSLLGLALFPNLVPSNINPAYSLTIYNAASSPKTLAIMRNVALLGMPFVLSYTVAIYWIFRGKVKVGEFSY